MEKLALPKNWSKRVCSAVLHVISLARFAIVHARPAAGGSCAELARAEADIELLKEELRIKDARLERIDPR